MFTIAIKMLPFSFIILFLVLGVTATQDQDFEELGLHYGKYLKEVVAALDKDQKFTETIKNMDANDIKSGKVAEQLKHVHEDIRKKLNDLKYLEIKRLRDLAVKKNEIEQSGGYIETDKRRWRTLGASLSQLPEHLGSHGTYFDINDLHKLMVAATNDLEKLDKERKDDYKVYEMEKDWQFQERLKTMNETEKQEAIKLRQQLKEKHDEHPKVHEPGTRKQFEEVWEKNDHLPKAEFDAKTFFALHDTNSDNHWDPAEVRQLLQLEISKLYDANNPEDDPNEMEEEYERMREHVYKEIDLDRDGLISQKEFVEYSKKPEFQKDNGWEDVSKKPAYSHQEYEEYMKNREKELRNMHGHYDPSYYANQPANLHLPNWGFGMPQLYNYPAQQIPAGYAQHPQAMYQQPGIPQQGYAQHPQAPYQQAPAIPQQGYAQHPQATYQQAGAIPQQGYQQPQQPVQQPQQIQHQQPLQQQQPQQLLQQQQPQQPLQQQQPIQQQVPQQQPAQQQPLQQQPAQQQPPQQQQQQQQPLQQQPPQQPPAQQQQVNQPQTNQQYYQPPQPQAG